MSLIEDYGYVGFKPSKLEEWNEYLLEDNTLIRLKSIPLKVKKINSEISINLQKIIVAFSPKNMKGSPDTRTYSPTELLNSIKNSDIQFQIKREDWNEYELDDGSKVSIKEVLNSASSTEKYDSSGDPHYIIQSQTNYKIVPKMKTT